MMRDLVHAPVKHNVVIQECDTFRDLRKNRFQLFDAVLKFLKE
ncbi:MAG: hypothetical protein WDN69_25650 [Aliidongia sp.]